MLAGYYQKKTKTTTKNKNKKQRKTLKKSL